MIDIESKKHLLNAVLEFCENIVTVKDLNFNYVAYNRAFLYTIGAEISSSIIGNNVNNVLPEDCRDIIIEKAKKTIETQESQTYTFVLSTPTQNKILKQTTTPIIENGVLQGILSVSSDVTNEENLKYKLFEKNYQLNTLLENLPVLAFMKDKNGNLKVATDRAKNFIYNGIDDFSNIRINMDEASAEVINEDNYVLQNKKLLAKEKAAIDYEGKYHWYKIYKAPILTDTKEIKGLVTIAQNIDKEKQLEKQRDLFLATLSHDLKNPLQAQISSLELLFKGSFGELNDSQREILGMIIESSKYMKNMLYTLLRTSKDNNGVIQLSRNWFSLNDLTTKCVKEIKDLGAAKNIRIILNLKKDKKIYADEVQIRRVIGNMLNNGINYAFENTDVNVEVGYEKNSFVIKISNHSPEISDNLEPHIFDKYVCGNPLENSNGIGLGLYFCKKILEAHEGKIKLERDGTLNTFIVNIPPVNENSALISEVAL